MFITKLFSLISYVEKIVKILYEKKIRFTDKNLCYLRQTVYLEKKMGKSMAWS